MGRAIAPRCRRPTTGGAGVEQLCLAAAVTPRENRKERGSASPSLSRCLRSRGRLTALCRCRSATQEPQGALLPRRLESQEESSRTLASPLCHARSARSVAVLHCLRPTAGYHSAAQNLQDTLLRLTVAACCATSAVDAQLSRQPQPQLPPVTQPPCSCAPRPPLRCCTRPHCIVIVPCCVCRCHPIMPAGDTTA